MVTMNRSLYADVPVIGSGKGGKTVAATMGRLGKRVVLVEPSARMYAGTGPHAGCVPSKALVHHARERGPECMPQDAARVRTTERGAAEADEQLRAGRPHAVALGDVNGGTQPTHISLDDSRIGLDRLLGEGKPSTAGPSTMSLPPSPDPTPDAAADG